MRSDQPAHLSRFLAQPVLASFVLSLSCEADYFAITYRVTSLPLTLFLLIYGSETI
jgi:hypothetical protein